jgi:flagellin-like protein
MKGVSPVIATILLIAVAIAVGILLTNWVTHLTITQMGNAASCSINTIYVIDSAEFNKTTALNSTLLLKVTNKGAEPIYGFGAIIDNGTAIFTFNSSSTLMDQGGISSGNTLTRERSAYLTVNMTNTTAGHTLMGTTMNNIKVTNNACPAVSASTTTVTRYP